MNSFVVIALATLAVFANASDDGQWHGDGGWHGDDGHWGGGHYSDVVSTHGAQLIGASVHNNGNWGGHGHGVVVRGPHTVPATIVGPSGKVHAEGLWGPHHNVHGHGNGWAGNGAHGWAGNGAHGWAGHGAHGVVVRGPHTVPATIVGPAGKVHAEGLWGPHHDVHHGHHW